MAAKPPSTHFTNPHQVPPSPYYHHVSQTLGPHSIITTAGQTGRRADGTISSNRSQEVRDALSNLSQCLEAAGASVKDIIKITYYKVDHDPSNPVHRQPMMEFLGTHRPPTTLVPVPALALPEMKFEIEVMAAIPQLETETVDVVVVGAGLSGLQAAVDLHKAGLRVRVLEARDRVGGKSLSVPVGEGVADVGAAWINDTSQSRMFALARRFGLELVKQNVEGSIVVEEGIGSKKTHPYGQLNAGADDREAIADIIRVRDSFEETCQKIDIRNPVSSGRRIREDLDEVTILEWIRSHDCCDDAVNAMTVGTRAMLGVEPSEISALFFLDYCKSGGGYMKMRSDLQDGGQYLRPAKGTQSFSRCLASELPADSIILQSPVRRIQQHREGVTVMSARGTLHASRVIVSVPTPLYNEIHFEPALPSEKAALASSTRHGDTCKAILFYERPWWNDFKLCGLAQSSRGPVAVTRDTSVGKTYSLTCFVVGQPAREWMNTSPEERSKAVLEQIQQLYSPYAKVPEPIQYVEHIWRNEQWSQGCPCPVMGPGVLTNFENVLRLPCGRVHFIGTETSYEWKGYMEGAVRSGERGAREVLDVMTKASI